MLFAGEIETLWCMRGLERFMIDLIEYPEIIEAIVRHLTNFFASRLQRALETIGGRLRTPIFHRKVDKEPGNKR